MTIWFNKPIKVYSLLVNLCLQQVGAICLFLMGIWLWCCTWYDHMSSHGHSDAVATSSLERCTPCKGVISTPYLAGHGGLRANTLHEHIHCNEDILRQYVFMCSGCKLSWLCIRWLVCVKYRDKVGDPCLSWLLDEDHVCSNICATKQCHVFCCKVTPESCFKSPRSPSFCWWNAIRGFAFSYGKWMNMVHL